MLIFELYHTDTHAYICIYNKCIPSTFQGYSWGGFYTRFMGRITGTFWEWVCEFLQNIILIIIFDNMIIIKITTIITITLLATF